MVTLRVASLAKRCGRTCTPYLEERSHNVFACICARLPNHAPFLQADEISLLVDLVHDPHTISEFKPHDKQTLEVDEAHYHFDTAPGVKVDAQALLQGMNIWLCCGRWASNLAG